MNKKNLAQNLLTVLCIFLFDRISKIYVIYLDKKSFNIDLFSSKFLDIHLIWNQGIAFGLFSFDNASMYNFLTIVIIIIILFIFLMLKQSEGLKRYSLIMILGGALGNVFDRIIYKGVPDFIDFHINNFHWFIFNIADIFITIGVIFMISLEFMTIYTKKK